MSEQSTRGRQGFASMDDERQREIASKGGKSVPGQERSFAKDHELAAEAGRKGGQSVASEDRSFSKDPQLASEAGRKGGEASHGGGGQGSGGNLAQDHQRGRRKLAGRVARHPMVAPMRVRVRIVDRAATSLMTRGAPPRPGRRAVSAEPAIPIRGQVKTCPHGVWG